MQASFLQMTISLKIEKTSYCKDSIGQWKFFRHHGRRKACDLPSFWMDDIQYQRNATEKCPLPKVSHLVMTYSTSRRLLSSRPNIAQHEVKKGF